MAKALDVVLLVVFGAWAYLMAKKKRRDEVGWAVAAAIAFFGPGYVMQEFVFPALAKSYGWTEAVQGAWQKPSGFIVGGICALAATLYLTLVVRPLPESQQAEGGEEDVGDTDDQSQGGEPSDG